ncbi:acyltransferase family protein [Pseudoclavibacter helvolus]|uniref:acyltransferase family protein n=1 Tax=Pseudoclavibacter helvolus TaxID=255205 RepID=UPI003736D15F
MPPTLREALSTRDNSLNFLRLCLAAAVILGHPWTIGGFENSPFPEPGTWAVNGFFAISGYLIAGSRMRTALPGFLWRRALRILPAFWACLIVTAFVVAPLAAAWAGERYELGSSLRYVISNFALSIQQTGIDATLQNVPLADIWNGSLWTLVYEFAAYVFAALMLTVPLLRKHAVWVLAALLSVVIVLQPIALGPLAVTQLVAVNVLRLGVFFVAGMLLYFLSDRIRLTWWPFIVALVLLSALTGLGLSEHYGQLPYGYALLWLGARMRIPIGRDNDISYGLYIWAWPVQQLLVLAGAQALGPWLSALLALVCTLPLAWLSWKAIEEPAMRLRHLVPARRPTRKKTANTAQAPGSAISAHDSAS